MNRSDEKVYRVSKRRNGFSLDEQKGQLVRLKQDLEQFKSRSAGATVVGTLKARIRDLEASVSRLEAAKLIGQEGREEAAVHSRHAVRNDHDH